MHEGTAQKGIYESIVRVHESKNWLKINGLSVKEINTDQLEYECFGGTAEDATASSTAEDPTFGRNAVMLYYERRTRGCAFTNEQEQCCTESNDEKPNNDPDDSESSYVFVEHHQPKLFDWRSCWP